MEYVFASAYGGAVKSDKPPAIHDMMRLLRIEIGAVEAKKSADKFGPKFPVRGAKDLAQKLANALNTLNMEAPVIAQEVNLLPTENIPGNERQSGSPVFRTLAHVKSTVRLIAPDTSYIDMVGSGHGGDVDDKSGGKASTYAWKDALLKGLCIPHEDMVDSDDDSSATDERPSGGGTGGATGRRERGADQKGSTSRGGKGKAGGNQGDGSVVRGDESGDETPASDLKQVLAAIAGAKSPDDLGQIRTDIKAETYNLHGADRLTATKAFMERQKELASE